MTSKRCFVGKKGFFVPSVILILLLAAVGFSALYWTSWKGEWIEQQDDYKTFTSCQDLKAFLKENKGEYYGGYYETFGAVKTAAVPEVAVEQRVEETPEYSETNIQVEGVDEADIVKTDGKYIYVVSGQELFIVEAYPAEESKIVAKLNFDGRPEEIFVNGDKLIVFGEEYEYYPVRASGEEVKGIYPPRPTGPKTFIYVYDLSDIEEPELVRNITMDGNYFDSRMIGDYVYVVVDKYIYDYDDPRIPIIYSGGVGKAACKCLEVHYFDVPDSSYKFTTILAVNVKNDEENVTSEVYLMGGTQNMYVSRDNIYITYTRRIPMSEYRERMIREVIKPLVSLDVRDKIDEILNSDKNVYEKWREVEGLLEEYYNRLSSAEKKSLEERAEKRMEEFEKKIAKEMEKTVIHKIEIDRNKIEYKGRGEVPGTVLNQFSMDEYNGYFRIATTTGNWRATNYNHLYVLDENLKLVGKLEDLAKGERIKSARFMGDRCYLVTFVRTDPLFVIDLKDPERPKVLGELKVSGYSSYLHPYDENHLIGIGKEAEETKWGARETGVKIALFDVSDVENPKEISKFVVEGNWAYTPVINDHKAFLFDKKRELLVIPIAVNKVIGDMYITTQGAYVFKVNLEDGIELKGIVEHEKKEEGEYRYYGGNYVKRSLYIDDVLYTISDSLIKMNDLGDLREINKVELE